MADRKPIESWLTDMDGVLIHEGVPIPGAEAFLKKLRDSGRPFLVLTNNSIYTARDLHARLRRMGLDVPTENIWTSALATAQFLNDQRPGGSAYVIGEAGLTTALHDIGYILTDHEPDFVILGETRTYSFEALTKAVRLINAAPGSSPPTPTTSAPPPTATCPPPARSPPDHRRDRPQPVLRRQAQPADDARGPERDRRPLRDLRDDRRPHGHRRARGPGGRDAHLPGAQRGHPDREVDRHPFRPSQIVDSIADLVDLV